MHRRTKRKLRRLVGKYRSFNRRTIIPYLLIDLMLFTGDMIFSEMGMQDETLSPLLNIAFTWMGIICLQLSGQFALGSLNAAVEKNYWDLLWQLIWFVSFFFMAIMGVNFGLTGNLL